MDARLSLLALCAACIIVAMFMSRPWTGLAWSICGVGFAAGAWYMWLEHLEDRREREAAREWLERFESLVDIRDVTDDGHLYEHFDREEWQHIFAALEAMRPGERSLRRAILQVDPSYLD